MATSTLTLSPVIVKPAPAGYAPLGGALELTPTQAQTLAELRAGYAANGITIGPFGGTIKKLLDDIAAAGA